MLNLLIIKFLIFNYKYIFLTLSNRCKRVSATRIRQSVATDLVGMGDENLEILATQFMKNRPSTTSKFYVQNWAQRETARLSMKCYGNFKLDDKCLNSKVPSPEDVQKWYQRQTLQVKNDFGEEIDDQELLQAIELEDGMKY